MVHNRIAVWRAERGLSRRALAEKVGVHPQTIGFIERGNYACNLDTALQIAEILGVSVEEVFSLRPFSPLISQTSSPDRNL